MFVRHAILVVTVLSAVPIGALAQETGGTPSDRTEIDGRTNPAGLPNYLVWRSAFRSLDRTNRDRETSRGLIDTIRASEADKEMILRTAVRSAAAEAANWERQKARLAEMQAAGVDPTLIRKALYDIDYEQRVTTLQARDGLLGRLSPEGRAALEAWVEEVRRSIMASVPTAELDAFRRPS